MAALEAEVKQEATRTRKTWRVNVREIAGALGIEVTPSQWVVIEDAEDDGSARPLGDWVDVVVWESQ